MPVDYCVCVLPVLIIAAAVLAVAGRREKTAWGCIAVGLLALFVLIYFVPGWIFWVRARKGDPEAQYNLGNYYETRLGYNWPDIEARDKWLLEAARQGHPNAMCKVGHLSIFGTSKYIPKDLTAARRWLEAAQAAGDDDALSGLRLLAEAEAKTAKDK